MINKKLMTIFLLITFVLLATTVVSAADSSDGETAVQSDMQANTVSTSDQSSDTSDSSSQATTSSNTQTTTNTHSNSETASSTSDTNNAKTTSDTSSSNTNTEKTSDANTHSTSNSDNTKNSDTQTTSTQTTTKDTTTSQSSVSDVKTSSSDTKEANNTLTTVSSNLVDEKTQLKTDYSIDPNDETKYTANSYDDLVSAVTDIKELTSDETYTIYLGDGARDETYEVTGSITWGSSTGTVRNLIIDGQNHVTIDGLNTYHFMSVSSGYNLTLQNMTIIQCTSGSGGAVSNSGNLTINGTTTFKDNHSTGDSYAGGGAIYNTGNLTITGTATFDSNTALLDGGAIHSTYTSGSNVTIDGATFINNIASGLESNKTGTGRGGAIYTYKTLLTVNNSIFINNEASRGGAICTMYNNTTVEDSYFYENTANLDDITVDPYGGGAIEIEDSNTTITGSTFTKNTANAYGGAINIFFDSKYALLTVSKNNLIISDCEFTENEAILGGGLNFIEFSSLALTTTDGTRTLENLIFYNNVAADYGGGMVYVTQSSDDVYLKDLTFYGNKADIAGGLAASSSSSDTYIQNSVFINNIATTEGGAYYEGGDITEFVSYVSGNVHYVQDCTFTGNEVTNGYGGAIFGTTVFSIENSKFTDNVAPMTPECGGGAIAFMNEIQPSSTSSVRSYINSISNSEFTHNTGYQGSSILIMGYSGSHNDRYNRSDKIENCVFSNDIGVNGIIETYNSINITKCTFSNDDETKQDSEYGTTYGAAIVLNGTNYEEESGVVIEAKVYVTDCLFENLTADKGGAIFAGLEEGTHIDGFINITDSTFYNCSSYYGGALYLDNIDANITSSMFFENYAITDEDQEGGIGGVIYISGTEDHINITQSTFIKNNATLDGGVIYHDTGYLNIVDSTFSLNTAGTESLEGNGGVIYATTHENDLNITNSEFSENSATKNGGSIYTKGTLEMTKSNFISNEAINGGAIYIETGSSQINNTNFNENTATENGGAIYNDDGTLILRTNYFKENNGQYEETIYTQKAISEMTKNTIIMNDYTRNAFIEVQMNSPIIDTTADTTSEAERENTIVYDITHPLDGLENSEVITYSESQYVTYEFKDGGVYTVDIVYRDSENTITFNVYVYDHAIVELETVTTVYPTETITITGKLTGSNREIYSSYTGKTVSIWANGEFTEGIQVEDDGTFEFTYTVEENYNSIEVTYAGTDYIYESIYIMGFRAEYIKTIITVEPKPDSINPTDEITFSGTVTYIDDNGDEQPVSSGTVTLYIDGIQIGEPQTITYGTYEVTFTTTLNDATGNTIKVQLGYNIIEAVYTPAEDTYYATAQKENGFNVQRISTTIQIDQIAYQEIGYEIEINGTLLDENDNPLAEKTLTVIIDHDVDYYPTVTTNSTGGFTIKFTDETSEVDIVTIRFAGDEKYEYSINTALADFEKIHTEIIPDDTTISSTVSEEVHVDGILEDTHDHVLTYTTVYLTDGENVYRTDTDNEGHYDFSYTPTSAGTMTLTVFYLGDEDHYEASETSVTLEVDAADTTLTLDPIDGALINGTVTITGSLIDENGNPATGQSITLEITSKDGTSSQTYTVQTDSDGTYTYTISFEDAGTYTVTASFEGNDDYNPPSEETEPQSFEVTKIPTSITIEPVETTLIGEDVTITGTVTADNGGEITGTVTITYDDEKTQEYTLETDGKYTFTITDSSSAKGTYQFTITYSGDNWYLDSIAESEFDIDKIPTSIEIDNIGSYKYGDQVTINGKLTAENNADLTDKTVTIVITSADGTDTLTIDDVPVQEGGIFEGTTLDTLASTGSYTVTVTFNEDDTYYGTSNSKEFTVDKKDITMEIEADTPITVGDTLTATITIKDDDTIITDGILTVTVNGEEVSVTLNADGTYTITYPTTQDGKYTIIAKYTDPNGNYNDKEEITVVTAEKIETKLSIDQITDDLTVGDTITITGKLTIANTETGIKDGSIIIFINGEQQNTVLTGDNGEFTISDYVIPANDQLEIVAIYLGDNTYDVSYDEAYNNVNKQTDAIIIKTEKDSYKVGDTVKATITLSNVGGTYPDTVTVTVNGKEETVTNNHDGSYTLSFTPETEGAYTIVATYVDENGVYQTVSYSLAVDVEKITTKVTIESINTDNKDQVVISGTLTGDGSSIDGTVSIYINGEQVESDYPVNKGTFSYTYDKSVYGTNTVEVYFAENNMYTSSQDTKSYTISDTSTRTDSKVTVSSIDDITMGDSVTITGTLQDSNGNAISSGTVNVIVNGATRTATVKDGVYTVSGYRPQNTGTYTVTVVYNGNDVYNPSTASTKFNVDKLTTSVTVEKISDIKINNSVIITGILEDNNGVLADKDVIITINDETITTTTDENGRYYLNYTPSKAGSYSVLVEYLETSNSTGSYSATAFYTQKLQTTITVADITAKEGETINLTAYVVDENNQTVNEGKVAFKLNDVTLKDENGDVIYVNVVDGVAQLEYTINNTAKNYTITGLYYGSDKYYTDKSEHGILEVQKANMTTTVLVNDITAQYMDTIEFVAQVIDEKGNIVTTGKVVFKLNGVSLKDENGDVIYVDVDEDGYARLEYTITNNPKIYNITAVYSGDEYYLASRNETAILNVTNRVVNMTVDSASGKSGDTVQFKATIKEDIPELAIEGSVVFKLNSVTLKDEDGNAIKAEVVDGVATLDYEIPVDMAGKDYNITAVYSNKNYERAEANNTLTVERSAVTTTLTPLTTTEGTNARITAVLYDENGNQLERSTKVAIKINGKTVVHTTTENGVLNVTIPTEELSKGDYTINVVFGENSAYTELRLNTTLKIV